jgi:DNA-binding MarR family transcriptional regulator
MAKKISKSSANGDIDPGMLPELVGFHLRRAQSAMFQHFAANVSGGEISPGHFGVLVLIETNPGMSQSALALALNVDRSSIVPVINALEGKGLVSRTKKPDDRRTHELNLTAKGKTKLKTFKKLVIRHDSEITSGLTRAEKAALIKGLSRITDRGINARTR